MHGGNRTATDLVAGAEYCNIYNNMCQSTEKRCQLFAVFLALLASKTTVTCIFFQLTRIYLATTQKSFSQLTCIFLGETPQTKLSEWTTSSFKRRIDVFVPLPIRGPVKKKVHLQSNDF